MALIMSTLLFPLERLPTELLVGVAYHLTTQDYCSLRLSGRLINHKLFEFFATEFSLLDKSAFNLI
jgi:hypothetical protein